MHTTLLPPPLDEFDRDRLRRRDLATSRISRLNRWWLIGQIASLGSLCGGFLLISADRWVAMLSIQSAFILSLCAAGASAGVTFWNWSVLPFVWKAVGLAPWAVLLMEATALVLRFA